jgi:hypothetical protein
MIKYQRRLKVKRLAKIFEDKFDFAYSDRRDLIECYCNQRFVKCWSGGTEVTSIIDELMRSKKID